MKSLSLYLLLAISICSHAWISESSLWIGSYRIDNSNLSCSRLLCKCCPVADSVIIIDKNTASRKENSYILRGESTGPFCNSKLLVTFEVDKNLKESYLTLFEKEFKMHQNSNGIRFECFDSDSCSFFASRVSDKYAEYDTIINIDSILSVTRSGWDVWVKDKEDFDRKSKKDTLVIGVAGLYNKGKTWIINKVSNKNFTAGFHVHTAGLSIKYAEYENKAASYLDTAGFETPISFYEQNQTDKFEGLTLSEIHQLKLKDRHITEHFIQNFIFEKSEIILIVVGHLTFSDQKLINRILTQYGQTNKEILILHNYFEIREIKYVMDLIERDIKSSFNVKVAPLEISKELSGEGYFHQEIYLNRDYQHVRHIVTASDGSAAGDYFNPAALDLLRALVQSRSPSEPFPVVDLMSEYLKNNINKFAYTENKNFKVTIEDVGNTRRLRAITEGDLKLKPISFDVNGAMVKTGSFEYHTDYDLILQDEKLVFKVDLPGLKKNVDGKSKINYKWDKGERSCLIFDAELGDDVSLDSKSSILSKNRKRGQIRVTPPCLDQLYYVEDKHEEFKFEDGVLTLVFKIEKKDVRQVTIEL